MADNVVVLVLQQLSEQIISELARPRSEGGTASGACMSAHEVSQPLESEKMAMMSSGPDFGCMYSTCSRRNQQSSAKMDCTGSAADAHSW